MIARLVATLALVAFALSCYAGISYEALFWGGIMLLMEIRIQHERVRRVKPTG